MFFYKRVIKAEKEGESDQIVHDFFNPNNVIRGVWFGKSLIICLNDGHEQSEFVSGPQYNKAGKMIREPQKARVWKMSEIELDEEDAARFKKLYEPVDLTGWDYGQQEDEISETANA